MMEDILLTPYDEPIAIYVGLLEGAFHKGAPTHDYQQTLDTLKKFRGIWLRGYEEGRKQPRGEVT